MAIGTCRWETHRRYQDLDALVDYREYDGEWTTWFEEHWLKPRLRNLGPNMSGSLVARRVIRREAFGNEYAN